MENSFVELWTFSKVSETTRVSSKKKSLLVVVGTGSALAQRIVPELGTDDLFIAFSTSGSTIEYGGKSRSSIKYDSGNYDSIRQIFESSSLPARSEINQVRLVSFTGAKDTKLFISLDGAIIENLLSINFTVNAFFANLMIRKYRGIPLSMVFLSSAGALSGGVGLAMYSSAKQALSGMVRGIAIEYGRLRVNANIVALGALSFGMRESVSQVRIDKIVEKTSTGSFIEPHNVSKTIRFLLSNRDINGAVVPCDGGFFG